jgi:hypothetical protein
MDGASSGSLGQDGPLDLLLGFMPSTSHCVCAGMERSRSRLARAQPDARALSRLLMKNPSERGVGYAKASADG